jgi:hypothetical protein
MPVTLLPNCSAPSGSCATSAPSKCARDTPRVSLTPPAAAAAASHSSRVKLRSILPSFLTRSTLQGTASTIIIPTGVMCSAKGAHTSALRRSTLQGTASGRECDRIIAAQAKHCACILLHKFCSVSVSSVTGCCTTMTFTYMLVHQAVTHKDTINAAAIIPLQQQVLVPQLI